jgi:hypothetical protein
MNLLFGEKTVVPFACSEIRFKDSKIEDSKRFLGPGYYESKTFIDNLK